ncbi:uncharacterized protein LOC117640120 [Thrips palmi]|uniref:Uncharacterized protein LOC117640120 n=1 Tax=Thrips palmi TaxID=161013 RepID=A0A6P8XYV1_THRPL|nr:uncharacterized protein LOC117640120 [Thrips palmi]
MFSKQLTIFAFAGLCLAAALLVSAEEGQVAHVLVKRSGNDGGWYRRPGSPTMRRTIKVAGGQQVDYTVDAATGHKTSSYLALGKNARQSSPQRTGQPHSGGQPSTSKQGKKGH